MERQVTGTCLCGDISFSLTGPLPNLYQCHCSLCRKQTGSGASAALVVKNEQLEWTSGQHHIRTYIKETGFRSDFCSACGSAVPNPLRGLPYYWVPAGALDSDQFNIAAHVHVASKAAWDTPAAEGIKHDSCPELTAFIESLQTA